MSRALIAAAFGLSLAACQTPQVPSPTPQTPEEIQAAVGTITSGDYLDRIWVIAHDSMRGRDTPSPELDLTARWIAGEFQAMGLEPGMGAQGFIQEYDLLRVQPDLQNSAAEVTGGPALEFGTDLGFPLGALHEETLRGGVVAVAGTEGWERQLRDAGIRGRHVLWILPPGSGGLRGNRTLWNMRRGLLEQGPLSILIVDPDLAGDRFREAVAEGAERVSLLMPWQSSGGRNFLMASPEAARGLVAAGGGDEAALLEGGDGRVTAVALEGVELAVTPAIRVVEAMTAPNVVGILPGSDPELRDEYVVFSAHMDHVGVGEPDATGDSIFNGADDDASGTVAVVEVAEAMAALETAPRRSMVFLLVSGEEKGLWGSEYFAEHPPVPVDRMVANLNMDMVGRNWPDTIVAIGKEHSDLGRTLNRVNEAHPELNMTAIDDRWPDERFYFRSDHYNFARKGVPVLFFFNGTHEDYHRQSDEVEKIDTDKASRIARLLFYLSLEIANADERPQWDPGSYREIVTGAP